MQFEKVEVNSERWLNLEKLLNEEWRDIKGYEGLYQISNYGRLKSFNYKKGHETKIIKYHTNKNYYKTHLSKSNTSKQFLIHRLVAQHFIPNPENKETVNHIDCNKLNNKVNNLEWNTRKENQQHAIKNNCINKIKMNKIPYDFLYQEYIVNKKSINKISKESNNFYSISTINRALRYYNIPIRNQEECIKYKDNYKKDKFDKIDFEEKLKYKNVIQIANELNCSPDYLYHYLPKRGIHASKFKRLSTRNI